MSAPGDSTLDTRGLLCPRPIIDLAERIDAMAPGKELTVLSDDPAFGIDLRAWCAGTGHELLSLELEPGPLYRARIRRGTARG